MRTITKLQTLLVLFLTTAMVCFMGCKDDDDDVPTPGGGGTVATYAISGTVMDASTRQRTFLKFFISLFSFSSTPYVIGRIYCANRVSL